MEDSTMVVLIFFIICACIVTCVYIAHVMPLDTPELQHENCTKIYSEGVTRGNHRFSNNTIICPPLNQ